MVIAGVFRLFPLFFHLIPIQIFGLIFIDLSTSVVEPRPHLIILPDLQVPNEDLTFLVHSFDVTFAKLQKQLQNFFLDIIDASQGYTDTDDSQ
jgi:hypothetical protein